MGRAEALAESVPIGPARGTELGLTASPHGGTRTAGRTLKLVGSNRCVRLPGPKVEPCPSCMRAPVREQDLSEPSVLVRV